MLSAREHFEIKSVHNDVYVVELTEMRASHRLKISKIAYRGNMGFCWRPQEKRIFTTITWLIIFPDFVHDQDQFTCCHRSHWSKTNSIRHHQEELSPPIVVVS